MKRQVVYVSERDSALRVVHLFDRVFVLRKGTPIPPRRLIQYAGPRRVLLFGLCGAEDRDLVSNNLKFVTCRRCLAKLEKRKGANNE